MLHLIADNATSEENPRSFSSSNGVTLLPSSGVMLNLHSLDGWFCHPFYRVSPSYSISAPCLSKWSWHPASTSSAPKIMLCGSLGTWYAVLAYAGSFFIASSNVFFVLIGTAAGVSNSLFCFCIFATIHFARSPMHDMEAAVSRNAVVLLGLGGGRSQGFLSATFIVLLTMSPPAGPHRHSPFLTFLISRSKYACFLFLASCRSGQYAGR